MIMIVSTRAEHDRELHVGERLADAARVVADDASCWMSCGSCFSSSRDGGAHGVGDLDGVGARDLEHLERHARGVRSL